MPLNETPHDNFLRTLQTPLVTVLKSLVQWSFSNS